MATRVDVAPAMIRWAIDRSRRSPADLAKFPVADWESRTAQPTCVSSRTSRGRRTPRSASSSWTATRRSGRSRTSERLRTPASAGHPRQILDTIYAAEQRQDWYRDFAEANGADPVELVGSLTLDTPVADAAHQLRDQLGFGLDRRVEFSNWTLALAGLIEHAEDAGILVMVNGVVGSNTHRPLDPEEFRGFALADRHAPVVFINGSDTKAAQVFTLAHELAHISLGKTRSRSPTCPSSTTATGPSVGATRWRRNSSSRWRPCRTPMTREPT